VQKGIEVAPYGLRAVFTDSPRDFGRLYGGTPRDCCGAYVVGRKGEHVIGVFDGNLYTLVHECVHAATAVLQQVGIDPLSNQSEPLAYLVDWLVAQGARALGLR
jgi:hypothetical protein